MTADQFKGWRESLGISPDTAAELLGVAISDVIAWESGGELIPDSIEEVCGAIEQAREFS